MENENENIEIPDEENQDSSEVYSGTEEPETESADSSGQDDFASGETVEVVDSPEAAVSGLSYNVAVLFVLSMIVGLLIYNTLSRRWS